MKCKKDSCGLNTTAINLLQLKKSENVHLNATIACKGAEHCV